MFVLVLQVAEWFQTLALAEKSHATHDDILFAPHKTPNFDIKQVRMNRGSQQEILIEHFQPSKYLLDALAAE